VKKIKKRHKTEKRPVPAGQRTDINELLRQALALHQAGQLQEAEKLYRQILSSAPDHPDANHLLGILAQQTGKNETALQLVLKAIARNQSQPFYHNSLGNILKNLGRLDESIAAYRDALHFNPDYPEALSNLGLAFMEQKKFNDAAAAFQRSIQIRPDHAESYNNLGNIYTELKKFDDAESSFLKALQINNNYAEAYNNLGNLLKTQNKLEDAVKIYEKAASINPNHADILINLGATYKEVGQPDKAIESLLKSIQLKPGNDSAYYVLGGVYKDIGNFEKAILSFEKSLEIQPDNISALAELVSCRQYNHIGHDDIVKCETLLASSKTTESETAHLHFTLGKIFNDVKLYDRAFHHYQQANLIRHRTARLNYNEFRNAIDSVIHSFPDNFQDQAGFQGSISDMPVFIIGMPRSGTSLVEQIIASHPQIHGAGELDGIKTAIRSILALKEPNESIPDLCKRLDADHITELTDDYFKLLLQENNKEVMRASDKYPQNFLALGWIALLFPRARIIHCIRHPLDTCLSIYFQNFKDEHMYANDLAELGQYYCEYERLMKHWQQVIPLKMHELHYEELINEPESTTRQLIDFLGLEWDDSCLSFHKTPRAVKTASSWQARQPIYNKSMQRWRNYEPFLKPLIESLDKCKNTVTNTDASETEAILHQALACLHKDSLSRTQELCQQVLAAEPGNPAAYNILGMSAHASGDYSQAIAYYRQAINRNKNFPEYYFHLGLSLFAGHHFQEAISSFQKAIQLKPDFTDVYNDLGLALEKTGETAGAIDSYQQAIRLNPEHANAHLNLGELFRKLRDYTKAETHLREALRIRPDMAEAHNDLGNVFLDQGIISKAVECYDKAIRTNPGFSMAYNNLGNALTKMGRPDKALKCYDNALLHNSNYSKAESNRLFTLHYSYGNDGPRLSAEHLSWGEKYAGLPAPTTYENNADPDRRLRIGYVSPDFSVHSVSFFFEPLLRTHDRSEFETFCYADVRIPDQMTERLRSLSDRWQETTCKDDDELFRLIQADRIDILVDLTGHTAGNRLSLFARKPAPVQATYLGYPNTTGLKTMDYRITDNLADPAGLTDAWHSEKLIRLPHGFLCYQPPANTPPVGPLPSLQSGKITFGSFNNLAKVTPEMIAAWSAILAAVPGSQIILKANAFTDKEVRESFAELFQRNNITAGRIQLLADIPSLVEHLSLYNRIDTALDTFPYHGTTTTCEALWMGVPVITLGGRTHVSRVGVSVLSHVDLSECITGSVDEYIEKAVQLAGDIQKLQVLRAGLRDRMAESNITNAKRITRSLETAYRDMWVTWCQDNSPGKK